MTPSARLVSLLAVAAVCLGRTPAAAQSWLLRFNAAAQRVEFRGLTADSIAASAVSTTGTSGPLTPDGYAAYCPGTAYCYYYREGPLLHGVPASAGVDMSMWGLGVQGMSVRLSARAYSDLNGHHVWPGTSPPFNLLEGYVDYVRGGLDAQLGRLLERGRLASAGTSGIDGLRATYQLHDDAFEFGGYAGWGMARGTVLTVTSPAVDPLDEYQPSTRQIVVGATAGVNLPRLDLAAEYRRELDPVTDYIVAERAALSGSVQASRRIRVVAGADYDLAQAHWGSAEASVAFSARDVWVTLGAKHYRPFFDLWTVWGVFSPVPFNDVNGSVAVNPITRLQLRGNGEWFKYGAADVTTPTVDLLDHGWRWGITANYSLRAPWTVEAGAHGEGTPGASSSGVDGSVTWRPTEPVSVSLDGGSLERPLELRFQDAGVRYAGGSVDYHRGNRWRFGVSVERYWESRNRPDAASFDWNQWRLSARASLTLRSSADNWLPPARPAGSAP